MKGMSLYYGSRAVLSAAIGLASWRIGFPWWGGLLTAVLVMGWFLWAPRSGRYAIRPENGPIALRRDERSDAIAGRARNTLAVVMLGLMVATLYFGTAGRDQAPTALLASLLAAAALTYFASDAWLRSRS